MGLLRLKQPRKLPAKKTTQERPKKRSQPEPSLCAAKLKALDESNTDQQTRRMRRTVRNLLERYGRDEPKCNPLYRWVSYVWQPVVERIKRLCRTMSCCLNQFCSGQSIIVLVSPDRPPS